MPDVVMTHSSLPGQPKTVDRNAYRNVWYFAGWRSADDAAYAPPTSLTDGSWVHVPAGWGEQWRRARQASGTRIARVHFWGDSITVGDDAGSPSAIGDKGKWITDSYVGRTVAALQARYGDAGSGFHPVGVAATTGTWTAGLGYGGCASAATAAATMTFQKVRGTTVAIYHRKLVVAGSFRYRIDGGAWTTKTLPDGTGFQVDPGAIFVNGLSDAEHLVEIEWLSGSITIHGVDGRRGTTGIRPGRFGQHGQAASHYSHAEIKRINVGTTNASTAITIAGAGGFAQSDVGKFIAGAGIPDKATISAVASATAATLSAVASATATVEATVGYYDNVAPIIGRLTINPFLAEPQGMADLCVIALGVNDPAATYHSERTWREGIANIIKPYQDFTGVSDPHYTPDYVFIVNHMGKWFDLARMYPRIVAATYEMAASLNAAVIDAFALGARSWLYAKNDMGASYWAGAAGDNDIHPSAAGHKLLADALIGIAA